MSGLSKTTAVMDLADPWSRGSRGAHIMPAIDSVWASLRLTGLSHDVYLVTRASLLNSYDCDMHGPSQLQLLFLDE